MGLQHTFFYFLLFYDLSFAQRSQPTSKKRVAGAILKMREPDRTRERVPEGENKGEKVPQSGPRPRRQGQGGGLGQS